MESTVAGHGDLELISRLRAGDEAAFMAWWTRSVPRCFGSPACTCSRQAVAEDVVQDAWIGVLKGIDRFEGRSSLRTWIFRIVTNIAKTRGQREGRSVPFASLAGDDLEAPSFDPSMFLASDDPELARPLVDPAHRLAHGPRGPPGRRRDPAGRERAIDALPPMQAEVIRLRDVRGWTQRRGP